MSERSGTSVAASGVRARSSSACWAWRLLAPNARITAMAAPASGRITIRSSNSRNTTPTWPGCQFGGPLTRDQHPAEVLGPAGHASQLAAGGARDCPGGQKVHVGHRETVSVRDRRPDRLYRRLRVVAT